MVNGMWKNFGGWYSIQFFLFLCQLSSSFFPINRSIRTSCVSGGGVSIYDGACVKRIFVPPFDSHNSLLFFCPHPKYKITKKRSELHTYKNDEKWIKIHKLSIKLWCVENVEWNNTKKKECNDSTHKRDKNPKMRCVGESGKLFTYTIHPVYQVYCHCLVMLCVWPSSWWKRSAK